MEKFTPKRTFSHYLYFLLGQQFSMLGSQIVGFVITWWITIETGSAIYLSISVFLMFIPQIVVTPFSGVIADRWNKKSIIIISDSMQAMATLLLFAFFLLDFQNIWFVLGMNTFRSALFAFQYPTVQSLIPTMVPKDQLSRINGINFLSSGIIFGVGPIIAATLLSFFPVASILLLDAGTFLIALIPLLLIKIPSLHTNSEEVVKTSMFKDFKAGLLAIKMIPGLFAMIVFAMIFNFISRPWNVLLPYFVRYTHEGSAFDLALLMTVSQSGNILGSLITSFKKTWKHKIKINIIGASLFFVGMIPAVLAPKGNFILMMIALLPGWVLLPITISTYLAILQIAVSKDKIGRVMSIDQMISMAIAPIGALISGPLAEIFGINNLLMTCAILGFIFPVFIWLFTKIKHLEIIDRQKLEEIEEVPEEKQEESLKFVDYIEPLE